MSEPDQVAETEAPEAQAAADAIGVEEAPADPAAGVDVANDPEIKAAEDELAEEAIPVALPPVAGRQAKVFLCERGHRTLAVWSAPTTCRAHLTRRSECGRQLYPIGELPEQVQKALNPLKASKKASKG
jgi:hypothetical protein